MCCTTIFSRRHIEMEPRGTNVSLLTLEPAGEVATGPKSALKKARYDVDVFGVGETLLQALLLSHDGDRQERA